MTREAANAEAGADPAANAPKCVTGIAKATTFAAMRRKLDRFFDRNPGITETDMLRVIDRLNRREWTFADVKAIIRGGKIDG